jgi:hypothetical protein
MVLGSGEIIKDWKKERKQTKPHDAKTQIIIIVISTTTVAVKTSNLTFYGPQ